MVKFSESRHLAKNVAYVHYLSQHVTIRNRQNPQLAVTVIVAPSAPLRAVILLSQIVGGALVGWLTIAWAMG
ncbi:hypothetical protein OEZ49_15410 [Ruegeria sp. WL0004]|uniref:Uncharacterized protein n=1 Tax=Ruegeria marisflavi TaxID=2984152 RepID=A0ABT2WTD2_9RHOB|nr:hypothetical protein [Ruegeria sp. WL0004]MCU9839163.1 hypothetical protein [Ruegeria sp. WL0004]